MENIYLLKLNEVRRDAVEKSRDAEISNRAFGMIYLMCNAARIARQEGLSALYEIVIPSDTAFGDDVRTACELASDGNTSRLLKVFTNRYWTKNLQGEDALIYYLLILSVFKIEVGVYPTEIKETLLSCLPDEAAEQYSKYADNVLRTNSRAAEGIAPQMLEEVRLDALEKSKSAEITETAFDMIYLMCDALRTAREKGLLALEEYPVLGVPFRYDVITAISLIVNAASADCLAEILTNRYWVQNLQGGSALIYYLLILSAVNMYEKNPEELEKMLLSYLPDEMAERYPKYAEEKAREREDLILSSLSDEAVERRYKYLKKSKQKEKLL